MDFCDPRNPNLLYQFSGGPGTGKTTVLKEIIRQSGIKPNKIAPMAYTGQAAVVMRRKGLYNARSIHSWIYRPVETIVFDEKGNPVIDPIYNRPKKRTKWVLNENALDDIDLIIIDEGPMCPLEQAEELKSFGKKIIACGDLNQLPPIASTPGFLMSGEVDFLTEIMRQKDGSSIIYISQKLLAGEPLSPGMYGNDVLVIEEKNFNMAYLANSAINLCATNMERDIINNWVRKSVFNATSPVPLIGERVVCEQNNWDIEVDGISLVNGLTGTVTRTTNVHDININQKTFSLKFRADGMRTDFPLLSCNLEYIKAGHHRRSEMKSTSYRFAGEKIAYAYAKTVHSTQGGQYPCGIYFMRDGGDPRMHYTAITRFSDLAVIVIPNLS